MEFARQYKLIALQLDLLENRPIVMVQTSAGRELGVHPALIVGRGFSEQEIYAAGHLHGYSDAAHGAKQSGVLDRVAEMVAANDHDLNQLEALLE